MSLTQNEFPQPLRFRILGWVMRSAVWAARRKILRRQFNPRVREKISAGRLNDRVTDADLEAQSAMIRRLRLWLRSFGILAEESGCSIPCVLRAIYGVLMFVADPLDGTKLFSKGELHRAGSQLALLRVVGDRVMVVAAYICDVSTGWIYGFDPWSGGVNLYARPHRYGRLRLIKSVAAEAPARAKLDGQWAVSRIQAGEFGAQDEPLFEALLAPHERGGPFTKFFVGTGSPTVAAMTALRGNACCVALTHHQVTIWDVAPFNAIMSATGFVPMCANDDHSAFVAFERALQLDEYYEPRAVLWIRRELVPQLHEWAAARLQRLQSAE